MDENKIPTKEIGELLDDVSTKIPKLIQGIFGSLYSSEAGKNMGQAVGNFYRELVDSGIPAEEALKMAQEYMLSLKDLSKNISIH